MAPASAAGPPPSAVTMWAVRSQITSSPGRQWTSSAISLHMVPEGRKTAASLPSSAATRAWSALVDGSSPRCSSPTSAPAMASRMAAVGRVTVSLLRSTWLPVMLLSPASMLRTFRIRRLRP